MENDAPATPRLLAPHAPHRPGLRAQGHRAGRMARSTIAGSSQSAGSAGSAGFARSAGFGGLAVFAGLAGLLLLCAPPLDAGLWDGGAAATLFPARAMAGEDPSAATSTPSPAAPTVALELPLGRWYRPGAWTPVHVLLDAPASLRGRYRPRLWVTPPEADAPTYLAEGAPVALRGGRSRFRFWILAGAAGPRLDFTLAPEAAPEVAAPTDAAEEALTTAVPLAGNDPLARFGQGELPLRTWPAGETLRPLPTERRLWVMAGPRAGADGALPLVAVESLPRHGFLYESVDVLILGTLRGEPLPPPTRAAADALAAWVARGGTILALDETAARRVRAAARARGWSLPPATTFSLPPGSPRPYPKAQPLGRGRILSLDARGDVAAAVASGEALRKRLERGFWPPTPEDRRLAPAAYDALPRHWPEPPAVAPTALARWLALWGIGTLALLCVPALHRRPLLGGLLLAGVTVLVGSRAGEALAPPPSQRVDCTLRVAGETGWRGPSRDERWSLQRPFANDRPLALDFRALPPPRPLAPDRRAIDRLAIHCRWDGQRGRMRAVPRVPYGAIRRRRTLLWRAEEAGAAETAPPLLARAGRASIHLEGASALPPLRAPALHVLTGVATPAGSHPPSHVPTHPPPHPQDEIERWPYRTHPGGDRDPLAPREGAHAQRDGAPTGPTDPAASTTASDDPLARLARARARARARLQAWQAALFPPSPVAGTLLGWEPDAPPPNAPADSEPPPALGRLDAGILRVYAVPMGPPAE